jgi:hypothetical protein
MVLKLPVVVFAELLWSLDIASIHLTAYSQSPTHQWSFRGWWVLQHVLRGRLVPFGGSFDRFLGFFLGFFDSFLYSFFGRSLASLFSDAFSGVFDVCQRFVFMCCNFLRGLICANLFVDVVLGFLPSCLGFRIILSDTDHSSCKLPLSRLSSILNLFRLLFGDGLGPYVHKGSLAFAGFKM